jgi:hypothetical protein
LGTALIGTLDYSAMSDSVGVMFEPTCKHNGVLEQNNFRFFNQLAVT